MPRIEYGPPGHRGVTQIQGLGYVPPVPKAGPLRNAGYLSAATWIVGAFIGSKRVKNLGLGGLLAVMATQTLKKHAAMPDPMPEQVQGW